MFGILMIRATIDGIRLSKDPLLFCDSDGGDLLPLLTVGLVHDCGNVELLLLGSESVDDDDGDIDSSVDNNGLSVGSFLDMKVSIPNASCALSDTY
jgi:hypothetical protein